LLVLLAAGAGSRWTGAGHKLDARLPDGRSILRTCLDTVIEAATPLGCPVVVIVGDRDRVAESGPSSGDAREGADTDSVHVESVHNPDWRSGQRSSLLVAIEQAESVDADAVVVGLADQPFVTAASWMEVASSTARIAVATYDGVRGHPVRLARELWSQVRAFDSPPDEGLRSFIGLHPELVEEVPCKGSPIDIDTVEDYDRWT
jgi:CTP:molybdopterin cytidylyltransferase MocA